MENNLQKVGLVRVVRQKRIFNFFNELLLTEPLHCLKFESRLNRISNRILGVFQVADLKALAQKASSNFLDMFDQFVHNLFRPQTNAPTTIRPQQFIIYSDTVINI